MCTSGPNGKPTPGCLAQVGRRGSSANQWAGCSFCFRGCTKAPSPPGGSQIGVGPKGACPNGLATPPATPPKPLRVATRRPCHPPAWLVPTRLCNPKGSAPSVGARLATRRPQALVVGGGCTQHLGPGGGPTRAKAGGRGPGAGTATRRVGALPSGIATTTPGCAPQGKQSPGTRGAQAAPWLCHPRYTHRGGSCWWQLKGGSSSGVGAGWLAKGGGGRGWGRYIQQGPSGAWPSPGGKGPGGKGGGHGGSHKAKGGAPGPGGAQPWALGQTRRASLGGFGQPHWHQSTPS